MSSVPDGIPVGTIRAHLAFRIDTRVFCLAFTRRTDASCQLDIYFIGTVSLRRNHVTEVSIAKPEPAYLSCNYTTTTTTATGTAVVIVLDRR
jgi:hypothetical protein